MEELHGLALSDQSDNHQRAEQDQLECILERDPLSDHETADQGGEEDHAPIHDHGQQDGSCQTADHKPDQQHALDIQVEKVRDIQKNVGTADKTAGENEHFLQKYGESSQKTAQNGADHNGRHLRQGRQQRQQMLVCHEETAGANQQPVQFPACYNEK